MRQAIDNTSISKGAPGWREGNSHGLADAKSGAESSGVLLDLCLGFRSRKAAFLAGAGHFDKAVVFALREHLCGPFSASMQAVKRKLVNISRTSREFTLNSPLERAEFAYLPQEEASRPRAAIHTQLAVIPKGKNRA